MRIAGLVIGALAALTLNSAVDAQELRVGVAAPLSGASSLLGEQVKTGAQAATSFSGIELAITDDACSAEGGARAAQDFIAQKAQIVVGFLCTEAIEAALPLLKDAGIPAIAVGVRADSMTDRREKTGWPVFRIAPRADDEREAAGTLLTALWREELFAIIDDGTIYGRELAESFRATAEQAGLKPVFVDTFRPQLDNQIGLVGRLKKASATHVFVGGDRDDIAIMARDAGQVGADMVFAGGETLRAASGDVPLAQGTLMVALPEWADGAGKEVAARLAGEGIIAEGYVLPAYAAIEIAGTALAASADSGEPPVKTLSGREFQTVIGPVRFDDKGDLSDNPYRLFRFDGKQFIPVDAP
ncbi:ABC transporter substrate-binding protein [Pseudaminobacter arsenicus]|uniref:ABC transporter substrate-binding protein n=1 Tax=Borborobacter arsenicus TaxID=1851146 RepID=A0A432V7B9_9HYPH|nr:branched-chain amino acid ABC transporter substrate-binding protein [Pseudaminobacter arsenicus]RUM98055.1 ABC transporter substrate-binding protein [Pseudaminobacter arsenicus]